MAFIHTWDTLNRKPNYPVAIDWRNGHSKGLVFVCLDLGDGNYYSIIQRGFSSITAGTAPTTAAHPHRWIGRSTLHNVTAAPYFPVATFTNIDITVPPLTYLGVISQAGNMSANTRPFGRTCQNGSSAPYLNWDAEFTSGSAIDWDICTGGSGLNTFGSYTTTSGGVSQLSLICTAAGSTSMAWDSVNGAIITGTTASVFAVNETSSDFIIGGASNSAAGNYIGFMPVFFLWNRALSTSEMTMLMKNPYQLLRPPPVGWKNKALNKPATASSNPTRWFITN